MEELSPPPPRSPASEGRWADLPGDIAISVASRLQEADVCALGGCSRSWRRACDADCVWEALFRRRWPFAATAAAAEGSSGGQVGKEGRTRLIMSCSFIPILISPFNSLLDWHISAIDRGWKSLYINHHRKTAAAISDVAEFVENSLRNGSLEAEYYLKAIATLASMRDVGFIDVQFFLLSRNQSAIINLIGLHYSIASLNIPPHEVHKALQARKVEERKVCVSLYKLGRWFYGFRLPDESESHEISLSELTMLEGAVILAILKRGAVHEVFRLQVFRENGKRDMPLCIAMIHF
uniref:F-box domain-containing protein n=1 Tax=Leersia perrieri TaxID=77586 RepID=A0A0D9WFU3_9ORYZ